MSRVRSRPTTDRARRRTGNGSSTGKHYDVFVNVAQLIEHVLVLPLDRDAAAEADDAGKGRHDEQMAAMQAIRLEIAREKGVDPANLIPLFEHLGQGGLTRDEMRAGRGGGRRDRRAIAPAGRSLQ